MINGKFGIIGAGKVGTTIAQHLFENNKLEWLYAHSSRSEELISNNCDPKTPVIKSIDEINELPENIIIAVNDPAITDVDKFLSGRFPNQNEIKIFHTSGVLPKEVLNASSRAGASVAAMHPFQTFFVQDPSVLNRIAWGIDCEDEDIAVFKDIAAQLNGKPVILNKKSKEIKALYHTAAVSASNYITTLIHLSKKMAEEIELKTNDLIPQIINTTVNNNLNALDDSGAGPALTGPIARGDVHTIRLHLDAMEDLPDLRKPYSLFGLATLEMAKQENILKEDAYNELRKLFLKSIDFDQ